MQRRPSRPVGFKGTFVGAALCAALVIGSTRAALADCEVDDVVINATLQPGSDGIPDVCGTRTYVGGTAGNDTLSANGNSPNCIYGFGGDDIINGGSGNDYLCGGDGNDTISGRQGNDQIFGEGGSDTIDGGQGDDVILGGLGDDNLAGGSGVDTIYGGPGADTTDGGSQNDTCEYRAEEGDAVLTNCEIQLYASIGQVALLSDAPRRIIQWTTHAEVGATSFQLLRREGAAWVPVGVPIAALPPQPEGALYAVVDDRRIADSSGAPATYAVLERGQHGDSTLHGPYSPSLMAIEEVASLTTERGVPTAAITPRAPRPRFTMRDGDRSRQSFVSRRHATPTSAPGARVFTGVRIFTGAPGLHRVTARELAAALDRPVGEIARRLATSELSIFDGETELSFRFDRKSQSLEFYAEASTSPFSDRRSYRVEFGGGRSMRSRAVRPLIAKAPHVFVAEHAVEEDVFAGLVVAKDPRGDFYFWKILSPSSSDFAEHRLTFDLPGAAFADEVRLSVHGASDSARPHALSASLNGEPLGAIEFTGMEPHTGSLAATTAPVFASDNTLVVRAVDQGDANDFAYLDGFTVRYRRFARADAVLAFEADEHGRVAVYLAVPRSEPIRVYDVTVPADPVRLRGFRRDTVATGSRIAFIDAPGRKYLVVAERAVRTPEEIRPLGPSTLDRPDEGADYVVVAPTTLLEASRDLLHLRSREGLTTKLVELEEIFEVFAEGVRDPRAVRDFLRYAAAHWRTPPRYVALVGRGHFDIRGVTSSEENLFPPMLISTSHGLFASDLQLGDTLGDDGVPELAIGRLPVSTPEELRTLTTQLSMHGTMPQGARALLIGDVPSATAPFDDAMNSLLPHFAPDSPRVLLTRNVGEGRAAIDAAWSSVDWVVFVGHGGMDRLSRGGVLKNEDLDGLPVGARPPIVTAWSCLTSRFEIPGVRPIADALIHEGKALAVVGPTSLTNLWEVPALATAFHGATAEGRAQRLGDALQRAVASLASPDQAAMVLLGDPAIVISEGP